MTTNTSKSPDTTTSGAEYIQSASDEAELRRRLSEKASELNELLIKHGELARRHQFLEKALRRAGQVQRSLLPDRLPTFDGYHFANLYRPCEAVGGDFYDFVQGSEDVVIIVSDVIGHGFEAALTTMLMRAIFQETATATREPIALLTKMNTRLHRFIPEGMFAAASVVRMRLGSPQFQFANAGLPYPFVLRAAEERVEEITLAGFPLGLLDDAGQVQYELRELSLGRGDVLLVGTDGLGCISGKNGEIFEDRRLREVLAGLVGHHGQKVIERLMNEAVAFGNGQPLPDDVNWLAVTRNP